MAVAIGMLLPRMTLRLKDHWCGLQAGHALVGALMPEYDPVAKISIVPRGAAGGLTFFAPSEERLESGLYRCVPLALRHVSQKASDFIVWVAWHAVKCVALVGFTLLANERMWLQPELLGESDGCGFGRSHCRGAHLWRGQCDHRRLQ